MNFVKIEEKLEVIFKNKSLLETAFVHKSYVNEHAEEGKDHNERLEFLGDAVLELVSTKHLFKNYPNQTEGEMTSFRSALVKGNHLALISRELGLGEFLFLSNGEEHSGGREKNYILANTLEAVIGAIYLDHGYASADNFIKKHILTKLDEIIEKGLHVDAKSRFQEICQERELLTPHYELLQEEGPDHNKNFVMGAYINDQLIAEGKGKSKQRAEEDAAKNALKIKGW